jgi:hypothetical protein
VVFEVKKTFQYIIAIAVLILAISSVRPYWDKYWIGKEVDAGAIYGTKNSIHDTLNFLINNMKKSGYDFKEDDFHIEKDADNRVTISVQYKDSIRVFGVVLKEVNLSVEKTASEVKDL